MRHGRDPAAARSTWWHPPSGVRARNVARYVSSWVVTEPFLPCFARSWTTSSQSSRPPSQEDHQRWRRVAQGVARGGEGTAIRAPAATFCSHVAHAEVGGRGDSRSRGEPSDGKAVRADRVVTQGAGATGEPARPSTGCAPARRRQPDPLLAAGPATTTARAGTAQRAVLRGTGLSDHAHRHRPASTKSVCGTPSQSRLPW